MTTHTLTQKTTSYKGKLSSTGQKITPLGDGARINNLENRINNQEQKLDKIIELLQHGNNLPNTDEQSS
jgi:hypothetical protein